MSLTREEWVAMWNAIKRMQFQVERLKYSITKEKLLNEIFYMKAQIQQVIGQME